MSDGTNDLDAISRRADLPYDVRDPDLAVVRSRADVRKLLIEVDRLREQVAELEASREAIKAQVDVQKRLHDHYRKKASEAEERFAEVEAEMRDHADFCICRALLDTPHPQEDGQ